MLLALLLTATLQTATPITGATNRSPVVPRHLTTLEGTSGAARFGLIEVQSAAVVPERLASAVAGLDGVTVLPLEFVGRSEALASLPATPRLRHDLGAGSRIELADGRGSILKVAAVRSGVPVVAFVQIGVAGTPRVLYEQPMFGSTEDPFLGRIGIAWDSSALLVATRPAAGGDVVELDLDTARVWNRTASAPPLAIEPDGLWLGDGFGFAVSARGVHRFQRSAGAGIENVPVAGIPPLLWRGDAALSPRGTTAVAIAGQGPDDWIPFVFGATGPAFRAAQAGDRIAPAGYLPDAGFGPFLAVADDGVTAAWRIFVPAAAPVGASNEAMIGRADVAAPPVMASGDAVVLDTLNEVGRLVPGPAGDILFAVGEPNDPTEGGLESAEVFSMGLDAAGGLSMRNVSGTSGDLVLPFTTHVPTWTPARFALVTADVALVHDDEDKCLIALNLVTGVRTSVLSGVRDVDWIEACDASGAWCAAVRRDGGARPWQVVGATSPAAQAVVLDPGNPSVEYATPTSFRRNTGAFASPPGAVAYVRRDAGLEFVDVVDLGTLQRARWSASASAFHPPLVIVGPRTIAFTRAAGAGLGQHWVWSFRGAPQSRLLDGPLRPTQLAQ